MMEESSGKTTKKHPWFWSSAAASIVLRLVLIVYFPNTLNFSSRPDVSTPITSLRRLAEGYWLKQSSMSPYAGSMYMDLLFYYRSLGLSLVIDFITAILIRAIGQLLQVADIQSLKSLGASKFSRISENFPAGDIAALVYLWNPLTIITCLGYSTSPIENLMIVLSLYGACRRLVRLAAFGWVMASHLSLYPVILIIPLVLLIGSGLDTPPRKLFLQPNHGDGYKKTSFSWRRVVLFFLWASAWALYVLLLCGISLKEYSGLGEMFKRHYYKMEY